MAPPVAMYVVAAVVGVAALFAFKEFVYEPHLAPRFEAWAEDFLERRRAARNRRASAVPVSSARRRRDATSSSESSRHSDVDHDERHRPREPNDFLLDEFELEALAAKEVDEWRNEVLRSRGRTGAGMRRRTVDRTTDGFDTFDGTNTTLDESFTSLTHTPLAYVISNISSPVTNSTVSLPKTPPRRHRSESRSTTVQRDGDTSWVDSHSPPSFTHEMPPVILRETSPVPVPAPRPPSNDVNYPGVTSPFPLAIPVATNYSPAAEVAVAPHPLPFTPTYQIMADDSPFGPLLPDTPRSSAEMYGERPFSPITRVMGSSCGSGSTGTYLSRANSASSMRTLGGTGILRRGSGLVNEVIVTDSDEGSDVGDVSTSDLRPGNSGPSMHESVITSLSERYPAPPTPPVMLSPPTSSIGVISAPSSPRSGGSEAIIVVDAVTSAPPSPTEHFSQVYPPLPLLQLPADPPSSSQLSRSRSQAHSTTSSAHSYASFLSPQSLGRAASESEGDEFLSVASDDSDWGVSPATPDGGRPVMPSVDRANNPFLDFEDLGLPGGRRNGSVRGDTSEGSEVFVSDLAREGGSEVGSDESWGSARRH